MDVSRFEFGPAASPPISAPAHTHACALPHPPHPGPMRTPTCSLWQVDGHKTPRLCSITANITFLLTHPVTGKVHMRSIEKTL